VKLTEEQLRLFRLCSEAHHRFPNTNLFSPLGATAKRAFELQITAALAQEDKGVETYWYQAADEIKKEQGLTDTEIVVVKTNGLRQYAEVVKRLYLPWYTPVIGLVDQDVKLRELTVTVHYSGVGITKEGAIRAWVFSPFYKQADIYNDVVHKLQHEVLKSLYKEVGYVPGQPAKIYVVGSNDKELRALSFETTAKDKMYQKELLLTECALENDIHYPVVPCLNKPCLCRGKSGV
jgi:hypothetical protein